MTKVKYKHYEAIRYKSKLPRKIKKAILGNRMSSSELRRRIDNFKSLDEDFRFCPNCGCDAEYGVYHTVEYPEVWNEYFCYRCHKKTAYQDNSPYVHILTYKPRFDLF